MGLPEAEAGHVQVGVLTRTGAPGSGKGRSQPDGVTWQCFDNSPRPRTKEVRSEHAEDTSGSVPSPESYYSLQPSKLSVIGSEVNPQPIDGEDGEADVDNLENLVIGVSNGAESLKTKSDKGTGCLWYELVI